jgi:hypothetical protein
MPLPDNCRRNVATSLQMKIRAIRVDGRNRQSSASSQVARRGSRMYEVAMKPQGERRVNLRVSIG